MKLLYIFSKKLSVPNVKTPSPKCEKNVENKKSFVKFFNDSLKISNQENKEDLLRFKKAVNLYKSSIKNDEEPFNEINKTVKTNETDSLESSIIDDKAEKDKKQNILKNGSKVFSSFFDCKTLPRENSIRVSKNDVSKDLFAKITSSNNRERSKNNIISTSKSK